MNRLTCALRKLRRFIGVTRCGEGRSHRYVSPRRRLIRNTAVFAVVLGVLALALFTPHSPAPQAAPAAVQSSPTAAPSATPSPGAGTVLLVDIHRKVAAVVVHGYQAAVLRVGIGPGVDGTQHGTVTSEWPMRSAAPCFPTDYARTDGDVAVTGLASGCAPWPWTISMDPNDAAHFLAGSTGMVVMFGTVGDGSA